MARFVVFQRCDTTHYQPLPGPTGKLAVNPENVAFFAGCGSLRAPDKETKEGRCQIFFTDHPDNHEIVVGTFEEVLACLSPSQNSKGS